MTALCDAPPPAIRRGSLVPPKVPALSVAELVADIEGREVVSLPELGKAIGMGEQARKYAIRSGLITPTAPLAPGARHAGHTVARDEAFTLVLAAALAVAAGVAIAVMLRGCKVAGLTGAAALEALRAMT
jgi:hypothetical protein